MSESPVDQIMYLGDILEQCDFQHFWDRVLSMSEHCDRIVGFQDSIRKFVCHVVGISFQTIDKGLLAQLLGRVDGMLTLFLRFLCKDKIYITISYYRCNIETLGEKIWLEGRK